jgi:hypothetical protein
LLQNSTPLLATCQEWRKSLLDLDISLEATARITRRKIAGRVEEDAKRALPISQAPNKLMIRLFKRDGERR